jgi:hypothetical protein
LRDYGAAGLFELARQGLLTPTQVTISLVVITLFIPCIANVLMIVKDYGWKTAVWVSGVVFPLAFGVGGVLNFVVRAFGLVLTHSQATQSPRERGAKNDMTFGAIMLNTDVDLRTCALCGYAYDAVGMACHTSCPLSAGCHVTCCPNCGYQTPDETKMGVAGALKRTWDAYLQKRSARQNAASKEVGA